MLTETLQERAEQIEHYSVHHEGYLESGVAENSVVQLDTITLLIESVMDVLAQGCQSQHTELVAVTARADRILNQLCITVAEEAGGQFSLELNELIGTVREWVQNSGQQKRLMPLKMALRVTTQIASIWKQGMRTYFQQTSTAAENGDEVEQEGVASGDYLIGSSVIH